MGTRRKWLLGAGTALLGLPIVAIVGALLVWDQVEEHPEWVARGIEWAIGWPEGSLGLQGLDVRWLEGRVHVEDLAIRPPRVQSPVVTIPSGSCDLPDPLRIYRDQRIDLGVVQIAGLEVEARVQRPQPPLVPPAGAPYTLEALAVVLNDARYAAPEDPPMKAVAAGPIDATFTEVAWTPALRRIEGGGIAHLEELQLGAIELTNASFPWVELGGTALEFRGSTFDYGQTEGMAWGTIEGLDERAAVEIGVMVEGDRIERAIETAIGSKSPVEGDLTLNLTLHAGGHLPRGAARFSGWMRLENAQFYLGKNLKLVPRLLVDIAPWFEREDGGWLEVGDLQGQASFGRGWVEIERLERPSRKHRILQAWGSLLEGDVDLVVRVVPKKHPERRGIGLTVKGPIHSPHLRFARREDLERAPEIIGQ